LNSSQVFAFNLFLPFFLEKTPIPLMAALGLPPDVAKWKPEFVLKPKEGTNVDMAWWSSAEAPTYCEIKLTEREFGPAKKKDGNFLRKYDGKMAEFYLQTLPGKCPDFMLEPEYFLKHYQIFRNIWLAALDDRAMLVFLMPRANTGLWQKLGPIREKLHQGLRNRIHIVAIEDVLSALTATKVPDWVSGYGALLQEKYVLTAHG
jgi:hypothetical protein